MKHAQTRKVGGAIATSLLLLGCHPWPPSQNATVVAEASGLPPREGRALLCRPQWNDGGSLLSWEVLGDSVTWCPDNGQLSTPFSAPEDAWWVVQSPEPLVPGEWRESRCPITADSCHLSMSVPLHGTFRFHRDLPGSVEGYALELVMGNSGPRSVLKHWEEATGSSALQSHLVVSDWPIRLELYRIRGNNLPPILLRELSIGPEDLRMEGIVIHWGDTGVQSEEG